MKTHTISKVLVDIELASVIFEVPLDILKIATKRNMGIMSIPEAARLLNLNKESLYAAASRARYNRFPKAVVPKINPTTGLPTGNTGNISILHKEFVSWVMEYKERQQPELRFIFCGYEGCSNTVDGKYRKFCSRDCFVKYRMANDIYKKMGEAGHTGKGVKHYHTGNPNIKAFDEKVVRRLLKPGQKVITYFI